MAHFAKIEDGIVVSIVVVPNEHELNGEEYLNKLGLAGRWVQTSYNASFGKKYAAIGDSYIESTGNFKPAQPFASWTFNNTSWSWKAPKPFPNDGDGWTWDENLQEWVAI